MEVAAINENNVMNSNTNSLPAEREMKSKKDLIIFHDAMASGASLRRSSSETLTKEDLSLIL